MVWQKMFGSFVQDTASTTPKDGTTTGTDAQNRTPPNTMTPEMRQRFGQTLQHVLKMPSNSDLQRRAQKHGLQVLNVMWEDTARYQGSSVGPNISDLTLQVVDPTSSNHQTHLLPVIRHPNFSDKTADVSMDKMWVTVGNQRKNSKPEDRIAIPLRELLEHLPEYLSTASNNGQNTRKMNLLNSRDSHVLVSAQHVFVPLLEKGKVQFNPVLYNYQSYARNPAVLTILATREGSSVVAIDNRAGDQSMQGWGQQLFYNDGGQKTRFTAERKSAVKARIEEGEAAPEDTGALDENSDMMLIIQVPLKIAPRPAPIYSSFGAPGAIPCPSPVYRSSATTGAFVVSDVEQAVLGHGEHIGPVTELDDMPIERDSRFPIRVTVQFYKATSNGVVDEKDLAEVKKTIDRVYSHGDYVGSLVVPDYQRTRPTDWVRGRTTWRAS